MVPVPEVSDVNSVRKPISARVATRQVSRTRPEPSCSMSRNSPLRSPMTSISRPWWTESTSNTTVSNGSWRSPFTSRVMTDGRDTASS